MDMNDAFPSKWLKSSDFEHEQTLTMREVRKQKVGDDEKPVLYFHELPKGLVLNKTNNCVIVSIYGKMSEAWTGKRLTLYKARVESFGEMVDAIRVKAPVVAVSPAGTSMTLAQAWAAYQKIAEPGIPAESLKTSFRHDCELYFGVPFDHAKITGAQWAKFVADGFVSQAPLPVAGSAMAEDEIPF